MAENAPAPSGGGSPIPAADPATKPAATSNNGTDPAKTDAGTQQGFDPSTLSDEEFAKVFGDPRTFTHPRFKALNEQAKEAERLKSEREQAENAQLEKNKQFEELAKKHETSAKEWQGKYQTTLVDNKIQAEASKLGITDVEAASKLLDRSGISIDDQGNVSGVEAAVKALAESKSYLVDKSKGVPVIGSPAGNPADGTQPGTGSTRQFKASEISDPVFYKEHAKEIDTAMRNGVPIIDDRKNTV
jgi:hypothetical protein